jgi:hypothetical protein
MSNVCRLAVTLGVDVIGYSRLMGEDGGDAVMQPRLVFVSRPSPAQIRRYCLRRSLEQ